MSKKYTQEKAEQLTHDTIIDGFHGKLIGKYGGSAHKTQFECPICHKIFIRSYTTVVHQKLIFCLSCGLTNRTDLHRLKLDEINKKDSEVGAIPLSPYVDSDTKRKYKCAHNHCDNTFDRIPYCVWKHKAIYCKKCSYGVSGHNRRHTQQYIELKYKELGFEFLDTYINKDGKYKTKCRCGKIFYSIANSILRNTNVSCGHCNDPEIGDCNHKLTVYKIKNNKKKSCRVQCKCECGQITRWISSYDFINGKQKSCGQCNTVNIIGRQFGGLTVEQCKVSSSGWGSQCRCRCKCGALTKWIPTSHLFKGNNQSCGNCLNQRNGKATSYISLKLQNIVEKILKTKCDHNKKIGKYCVDIVSEEYKIAIEYDGYYWHRVYRDTTKDDIKRDRYLLRKGYKVCRIQSNGRDIPMEEELTKVLLNHFQHGAKKKTITMKSWKDAEKRNSNKQKINTV